MSLEPTLSATTSTSTMTRMVKYSGSSCFRATMRRWRTLARLPRRTASRSREISRTSRLPRYNTRALRARQAFDRGFRAQPGEQVVRREGLREEMALRRRTAEHLQDAELLFVLDAFGDDVQAEIGAEVDQRGDDHAAVDAGLQLAHERAVDLDALDRQPLEVRERGVAGAEVVERDAGADLGQAVQDVQRLRAVGHHRALGDLELHVAGVGAVHAQQRGEAFRERAVRDVPRGEVHRHAAAQAFRAPA